MELTREQALANVVNTRPLARSPIHRGGAAEPLLGRNRRQLGITAGVTGRVMLVYLYIALGSALGGMARYWCSGFVAARIGDSFPWGTIAINILGSFVIGFFATLSGPDSRYLINSNARQFVMVGLCGGYTTFSSFSLQTLNLIRDGDVAAAGANIGLSVLLCMIAVWLGHVAAASLSQLKT